MQEYTFFSSEHGTFFRIDHILGHISNLSKFNKIEIISSINSDYNVMRLEMWSILKNVPCSLEKKVYSCMWMECPEDINEIHLI